MGRRLVLGSRLWTEVTEGDAPTPALRLPLAQVPGQCKELAGALPCRLPAGRLRNHLGHVSCFSSSQEPFVSTLKSPLSPVSQSRGWGTEEAREFEMRKEIQSCYELGVVYDREQSPFIIIPTL